MQTSAVSDGVTVSGGGDMTAPFPGFVNDGGGPDIDTQASTTTIVANWSGFSDPESGITSYQWAIGTTPGGEQTQPFVSVGTAASSASNMALSLINSVTYYVTVRATNGSGLTVSATSDGVTVGGGGGDVTAPLAGTVNDGISADIDVQVSTTTIEANWGGFNDPESGIVLYEWAIGLSPGGQEKQAFTSVGLSTLVMNNTLSLSPGMTLFVTVRAKNGASLTTSVASDGVLVQP
jgi:hypothetical protein